MFMKKIIFSIPLFTLGTIVNAQQEDTKKFDHDLRFELEAEYRYFYDEPQFTDQLKSYPAASFRPEYSISWNKGYEAIRFKGFLRLDRDEARTHWDIRELYYQKAKNNWELSIGLKKIFWGVAESNHLVDIINQTDAVETFDGEEKLGQPMVQFSYITNNFGTFDVFYLPYHRRRTFPGNEGRFRFAQVIDKDNLTYESGAAEWRQDFAIRWKHYVGAFDFGLSHFYGNGREPLFSFNPDGSVNAFYPVINQTGIDLQATVGAFLWKFEAIQRWADAQDFFAFVGGGEFTFSNVNGKGLDIGLLVEYLYDQRDELALSALQNDLFFGSRIALNDTQDTSLLLGGIVDLEQNTSIFSVEGSRRFGQNWTATIEARIFNEVAPTELLFGNFRNDSFLRISISRFF